MKSVESMKSMKCYGDIARLDACVSTSDGW